MTKKKSRGAMQWRTVDLHMHTPVSLDYQQMEASFLDILQRAEVRGLDIIAFTDHNSVAGYRRLQQEIAQLEFLESLHRLMPDEQTRLAEYRRLTAKILVLPGVEVTATFGFHILGIFPPETPVRDIEYLLIDLRVPSDHLDEGSPTVGATSDVTHRLPAYCGCRGTGHCGARQFQQRGCHARVPIRRADEDCIYPGLEPACTGSDRSGARQQTVDGGVF